MVAVCQRSWDINRGYPGSSPHGIGLYRPTHELTDERRESVVEDLNLCGSSAEDMVVGAEDASPWKDSRTIPLRFTIARTRWTMFSSS